ncbi:MAG: hypothetical protein R3F31_20335 [Verrucomicrobiales bacterium]
MLRLLILGIIFGAGAPTLWSSPLPELVPGGEVQIQLEHYPESAVVFVPDDFQPKAATPGSLGQSFFTIRERVVIRT